MSNAVGVGAFIGFTQASSLTVRLRAGVVTDLIHDDYKRVLLAVVITYLHKTFKSQRIVTCLSTTPS